ncbi:phage P22 like portal protein [Caudoviricetes sp.]|nr:phage P22 like portal protein [Caudoviricetes sp.]
MTRYPKAGAFMDKENETQAQESEEILTEAKERYKLASDYWKDNYQSAIDDMKFRSGDQWPEAVKDSRSKSNRPCLVVDKTNQYIRQVVNDGRQNRPSVKVRPVDSGADIEVAEVYQGVIRHILERSNADTAFDSALESAVVGGIGFFRVLTEYAHKGTFNQDIVVKRIRNPLLVLIDPSCKEADCADMKWAFFVDELEKEEFEETYPDAKCNDWETDKAKYGDWTEGDKVRVCEYWYVEEDDVLFHLLEDGTTTEDEPYQRAIASGYPVPAIVETRTLKSNKVKWCRMTGAEILEQKEWLGQYIPIIPVFGNEYDIDGKVMYSGLVRPIKDPQRLYNYSRSAFAERVALTPKAPYIAAAGQVENYPEWEDANSGDYSVLRYDPIDINGTALGSPQRQNAADIPAGFAQDMQLAEHDIQGAIGMYNASLGQQSNEKSGKAILARQREGDVGTFHYHDNLARAIRHLGRILVDLIPKIYDSSRVVRILGEDGSVDNAQIDPTQDIAVMKMGSKSIYNLNVGVYDVAVSAGASYTTKRQEAAEAMMQLTQANPALFQLVGDLMIRNMDWPQAEEIADRLKLMLPPNIQQAEKEEGQQIPPEIQQAIQMAQQQIQQQDQVIQQMQQALQDKQAEEQSRMLAEQKAQLDAQNAALKLQIDQYNAETNRLKAVQDSQPQDTGIEAAKLRLEQEKLQLEAEKAKLEAETSILLKKMDIDATGLSEQVDSANTQIQSHNVSNEAITQALIGLQEVLASMNRPKQVIRDNSGRIIGVQ